MEGALTLEQRRERIAAAREALRGLDATLWQAPSGGGPAGLAGLLGEVDALGSACDAARVAVVGEALERGETSGGSAAMTATQWVRHHAPSTRAGGRLSAAHRLPDDGYPRGVTRETQLVDVAEQSGQPGRTATGGRLPQRGIETPERLTRRGNPLASLLKAQTPLHDDNHRGEH